MPGGRWLLVLAVVALWQGLAAAGLLTAELLPPPSAVGAAFLSLLASFSLVRDSLVSVGRVLAGFSVAAVLGTLSGVALGTHPRLAAPVRTLVEVLRPIPPIAWIPLAVLWFGIGHAAAVFIVALGAFFPIFLNAFEGVQRVRVAVIHAARCLGARRRLLLTDVLLPAALPQILTGLRIGLGIAWTSVIAAELVGAQSGLGYMIQLNRILLQTENVLAGMLAIGLIGLAMNGLSYRLEARLTPWAGETLEAQRRAGRAA
jgi:NitT/TauT family transport system permease protein/sulfonate transport system permease protein